MRQLQTMRQNTQISAQDARRETNRSNPTQPQSPNIKKAVEYVFDVLEKNWASSFRYTYTEMEFLNAVKREWALALTENRVTTREQLMRGIRRMRAHNSNAMPNVGKFIDWCLKDEFDDSFDRFIRRQPLNSMAEQITAGEIGYQCRTQLSEGEARRLWSQTIARYRQQEMNGELQPMRQENRMEAPETKNASLTQEQRDEKMDREIEHLLSKGYRLLGALKTRHEFNQSKNDQSQKNTTA